MDHLPRPLLAPPLPTTKPILSGYPFPLCHLCLAPPHLPSQLWEFFTSWEMHPHISSASRLSPGPVSALIVPDSLSCCFSQTVHTVDHLLFCSLHTLSSLREGTCASFISEPPRQGEVCCGGDETVLSSSSTYICVLWVVRLPFLSSTAVETEQPLFYEVTMGINS